MSRAPLILMVLAIASLLASGCRSGTGDAPTAGAESRATDSDTRVVLTTSIDRTSIGIADRLTVHTGLSWEPPALPEITEPDWAQSGWTMIESTSTPVETRGGRMHQSYTYLIEPFLPGQYEVPAFSVVITPDRDSRETTTIQTEPLALSVTSVLGEDDAGKLSPVSATLSPTAVSSEERSGRGLVYAGIAAVLVCSVVVVLVLTRGEKKRANGDSIHDRLMQITTQSQGQSQGEQEDGYARLWEVYARLDPRLRGTSEIQRLMALCERARFAPGAVQTPSPAMLARHTLELLGSTVGGTR